MLEHDSTLHPRLGEDTVLAELRGMWAESRNLRIDQVLAPGLAEAIEAAAMQLPYEAHHQHDEHLRCLLWRCSVPLAESAEPLPEPLQRAQRFQLRDLPWLGEAISGRALCSSPEAGLAFRRFRKGSYLETHNERGPDHATAFVLGLTRDSWPGAQGGHLEFLDADREAIVERRPPGFDTLDLFDVHPIERWRRVPLLCEHVERLTLTGWLSGPPAEVS